MQGFGELHEQGLDQNEISRGDMALANLPSSHNQVQRETSIIDDVLPNILLSECLLRKVCLFLDLARESVISLQLQLLVRERLDRLIVDNRVTHEELLALLEVLLVAHDNHSLQGVVSRELEVKCESQQ